MTQLNRSGCLGSYNQSGVFGIHLAVKTRMVGQKNQTCTKICSFNTCWMSSQLHYSTVAHTGTYSVMCTRMYV